MSNDVFISYAREDRKFARRLATAFARPPRGWSVWWDRKLTTGERFSREIREAIETSRWVVVMWSAHSAASDWVSAEAEAARERGILVPVLIADCEIPMPFGTLHSADLQKWRGSESAPQWLDLLAAVEAAFARGPELDASERTARHRRMQAFELRRRRLYGAGIALAGILLGLSWWLSGLLATRNAANHLAAVSASIRDEGLASAADKFWWWRLFDDRDTLEHLEASFLVATEAMRKASTASARDALDDSFALLPWSDRGAQIARKYQARTLQFDPSGKRVISAAALGDTLLWNLEDAQLSGRIAHGSTGDENWIRERGWGLSAGAQMADINGELIATAGTDAAIRLWTTDGAPLRSLEHRDVTSIVRFSPDGNLVAAADESGEIRLWATGSGRMLRSWNQKNTRGSLVFSARGDFLASNGDDGTVIVWETTTGRETMRVAATERVAQGVAFVPGKRQLLSYGTGAAVWNIDAGKPPRRFADEQEIYAAVFDRTGKTVVLGGDNGLEWWDFDRGQRLFRRDVHYPARIVADRQRKTLLAMSFTASEVQARDFASGRLLRRIPFARDIYSIAIDPAGKWLAVVGGDWESGKDVIEFAAIRPPDLLAHACAYSSRNLSLEEWDRYLGDEPYRLTCPDID